MTENHQTPAASSRDTSGVDYFGDTGQTQFGGHGEVSKNDVRYVAYDEVDAAGASVSVVMAAGSLAPETLDLLLSVQNDLFDVLADLSQPLTSPQPAPARVVPAHVERLERAIEHYTDLASDLSGRILPGGTLTASLLFQARGVVRRAERAVWLAVESHPEAVNREAARYMNRLSALLFVIARGANVEHGDVQWVPESSVHPAAPEAE